MASIKRVKRPTSIDVARLAGVSQTTVSLVVNDVRNAGISEETRIRVLQAIDQLDYQPHEAARSLRSRATRIIGMAIPEAYNTHLLEVAAAAELYAQSQEYSLFLSFTDFDVAKEQASLQLLKQQRYDALILFSRNKNVLYNDLQALRTRGYPVIILGFDDTEVDTVSVDTRQGEEELLNHLVALGHKRIGYIYGVADQTLFGNRLESCLSIQRALGLVVEERFIKRCGPGINDGYAATLALLAECPVDDRPTALIVVNDLLAGAVLAALYSQGIHVPTQMSLASFDNTPLSPLTLPPLTTVDCEARNMGQESARLAISRLATPERPTEHVKTHSHLIVRGSTGPARSQTID